MLNDSILHAPIELIVRDIQPRKRVSREELRGLTMTVDKLGVLQPIRVRRLADGRFKIIYGERRYLAAKAAGHKTVPVIVEEGPEDEPRRLCVALIENLQRAALQPIETAEGIQQLMNLTGWNATQTATVLGLSSAKITKALSLLPLPEPIKAQIAAGKIPATTAYEIARQDPSKQLALAERVAAGELKRDEVSTVAKGQSNKRKRTPRITSTLGKGCSVTLSGAEWTLPSLVAHFDELSGKAKSAIVEGTTLEAFLKSFKTHPKI